MSADLRDIRENDLCLLRKWKNEHKGSFFYKEDITEEQQTKWYGDYLNRENDFMYMVVDGDKSVGCMGIRLVGNEWDVYNVILGLPEYEGTGLMSDALGKMLRKAFRIELRPIVAKVIKDNPAVGWYKKNQFKIGYVDTDHYIMRFLDWK